MNRNKKVPVVGLADRDEAAAVAAGLPAEATIALEDITGAIRDGLLAFSCSAGMLVIGQIMAEEMTTKVGPKGRHDPDRVATRNGTAPGSVALGGRMVPVDRPRATLTGGGELTLDSYALFSSTDLLGQLAVERMLAGVATRRHADVAEPIGAELEAVARGDSRSAISRRFKTATAKALDELLARDLTDLDVAVLMIDGIIFAEVCCVVALAITADGTKVPVGLWDGDTENGTVVTDLLADLVARGLRFEHGLLVVIDGAKALATGVKKVFAKRAIVQRCTLHKRRNCAAYLPDELAGPTDRKLAKAFNDTDAARGKRVVEGIARQLEAKYPSAASLREGLDDMFAVRRLGVGDRLARSLSCTNSIESMISIVRAPPTGSSAGRTRRWCAAGSVPACSKPSAASGASRAARTCPPSPPCGPRSPAACPTTTPRRPAVPSRNGPVTAMCGACGGTLPPGRSRSWCSDACRQSAWRRRHQRALTPPELPVHQPRKARTVYECAQCGTRLLGEQRCDQCGIFMQRVVPGGLCPCCDEPVAITDLVEA